MRQQKPGLYKTRLDTPAKSCCEASKVRVLQYSGQKCKSCAIGNQLHDSGSGMKVGIHSLKRMLCTTVVEFNFLMKELNLHAGPLIPINQTLLNFINCTP